MSRTQPAGYWSSTPQAAKWALVGACLLAVVAVVPFSVTVVMVSLERQMSPLTVIFGPGPGMPLITWLYYTVPPAAIQTAAALGLRHPRPAAHTAGLIGTLLVLTAALVWLGAMVYSGVLWLVTGAMAGDYYDMLGIVFFGMPVLVAISVINARASILAARNVFGQQASPTTR